MTHEIKEIIDKSLGEMWDKGFEAGYKACHEDVMARWNRITAGDPRKEANDKKGNV